MSQKNEPLGWEFVGQRRKDGRPVLFVPGLPARDVTYEEAAEKGWLPVLRASDLYRAVYEENEE